MVMLIYTSAIPAVGRLTQDLSSRLVLTTSDDPIFLEKTKTTPEN